MYIWKTYVPQIKFPKSTSNTFDLIYIIHEHSSVIVVPSQYNKVHIHVHVHVVMLLTELESVSFS